MRLLGDASTRDIRRKAVTVVIAVCVFGLSFGVLASEQGLSLAKASGMSLLVFAGASQFAAVTVAADGSEWAGVVTGLLLNSRLLAFGVLAAPLVAGSWLRRVVGAQLVVDEPVALALEHRDARRARYAFWFSALLLFVAWNAVTIVGAAVGDFLGDPSRFGLDAAFPAVFVALLAPRLADPVGRRVAACGVAIALVLLPLAPAGVPVLAASLGALAAGRRG